MINEFNTNVYGCYCLVFVNGQATDTAHSVEKHIDANSNILQSYAAVLCIFILYSWENIFVNQKKNIRFISNIIRCQFHREFSPKFETKGINCCCLSTLDCVSGSSSNAFINKSSLCEVLKSVKIMKKRKGIEGNAADIQSPLSFIKQMQMGHKTQK